MKEITWDNPNKMHFESPHKTFNRQTKLISVGNCIHDTQVSNYVRPYHETECNGSTNPPGHLQNYDLTENIVGSLLPTDVREKIRKYTHIHGGIVYHFHHWRSHRRIPDGIVLTDRNHKLIEVWYLNSNTKSWVAVDEAIKYVTEVN